MRVERRIRLEVATIALTRLYTKIATTPILKHFDSDRSPVIVVYASQWVVSDSLLQIRGLYWYVAFLSRKPED